MEPKKSAKPTVLKENSYYYWWDEKNKNKNPANKEINPNAPRKISPSEAMKEGLSGSKVGKNTSEWNNMGTWEEKNFKVGDFEDFVHDNTGRINQTCCRERASISWHSRA